MEQRHCLTDCLGGSGWGRGAAFAAMAMVVMAGCTTTGTGGDVSHFEPLPQARVGASDLEPVSPRPVTDLLRDAEKAFQDANEAQERNDSEAALRHYTLMLELLIEADLDPAIFYSLREELGSILDATTQQASLYERHHPSVTGEGFKPASGFSEIKVPWPLPERVLAEIEDIQNRYPKNFQSGLDRSYRYVPYMRQELEKAGLPTELVWLAMVESLFTPKIVSRAGAGGMWQFMRATGRRYNLRVDSYVDERYNWQASTRAAIQYLKDLHDFFDGNWPLAVTAYNMGEGGLERAIAANGGERNLWRLIETPPASNRIRLETKKYYPKFLAYLIVTSNPERYGFKENPCPPEDVIRTPVKGMYALEDLEKQMGYSRGTLAALNPDLLREVTPPSGSYPVAVPAKDHKRFLAALKEVSQIQYGRATHRVRRGETISQIASRYGVSQSELMRLNGVRSARSLQVNQVLRIPGFNQGVGGGASATAPNGVHVVARGDTLSGIARTYGVGVRDLQAWNSLGRRSTIRVGQKLRVAKQGTPSPAPDAGNARYHVVRAGEYPAKIARAHNVDLEDLLQWNGLTKRSTIRVGDKLVVGSAGVRGKTPDSNAKPAGAKTTYKVKRGDTASQIAEKHGVRLSEFLRWNGLTKRSMLRVGDECVVYTGEAPAAAPERRHEDNKLFHVVKRGESAGTIAAKYRVPLSDFLQWNGLTKRSVLHVGDEYIVYTDNAPEAGGPTPTGEEALEGEKIIHVVSRGHNPTTIARRYGVRVTDLFKWNNWPKNPVLHIGDKVVVYKK